MVVVIKVFELRVQQMRVVIVQEFIVVEIVVVHASLKQRTLVLIKLLEIFLHLKVRIEVDETLADDTNQVHLVHENGIQG